MHMVHAGMAYAHDLRLVAVGALVCVLAAFTVFTIIDHVRLSPARSRTWVILAGLVSGIGIWATHFIAMLAYQSPVPVAYDPLLTLASAAAGTVMTGAGWGLSLGKERIWTVAAGLKVAAGITTLHFVGMNAARMKATVVWDGGLVAASLVACSLLSIIALHLSRHPRGMIPWRPALALIGAVCSLHFVAMGAVTMVPGGGHPVAGALLDRRALVILVTAGAILIVAIGFFVVLFSRVSDREKAAAKIAHLAYHDVLTGLSNRAVLDQHLSGAMTTARASGKPMAVVCIDLDGFKAVNDTHGHATGDALLIAVSDRLRTIVRGVDFVARTGGDEFILVREGGIQPRDAARLSERVIESLEQPFEIDGKTIAISASAGIATFPEDAGSVDELTRKADQALYRAKATGRGLAYVYDAVLEAGAGDRQILEVELAAAIREGALDIHYQPIANAKTGAIDGFEALLRWTHPQRGPIPPTVFIALAEESGQIGELGMWVLRKSCLEAIRWDPRINLSVNVSPVQLLDPDFARCVTDILSESGLDPQRLEVEVTESVLISNPGAALCIFDELTSVGVHIVLDDFGTGYSSLSYFRTFPFAKVKIDRAFIADLDGHASREIVRSIIELSRNLRISVVAEGIETQAQLDTLRGMGCSQVQGYLIGRPAPIGTFAEARSIERGKSARAA